MGRRWWPLALVLALAAVATAAVVFVVVSDAGDSIDIDLALQHPSSRPVPRDLEVFCTYVTKTGAVELLAILQDPAKEGSRRSSELFARSVAARAPAAIAADSETVASAIGRVDPDHPPIPGVAAAADRVDAYARSHCS